MKLVRNAVTEANPDLRGRKHHFTIESASADMLEAMDQMLVEAGWNNDTCPVYEDGVSCGYWVDLSDVSSFKKAYKEAKAGVKEFMANQVEAVQAETVAPVEAVAPFEVCIKGSVGIDNPFYPGDVVYVGSIPDMKATVETLPKVGDVIQATDWRGNVESRVKVREALNDYPERPEHLQAAMNAHHHELFSGFFNDRQKPTPERKHELEQMPDDRIYQEFGVVSEPVQPEESEPLTEPRKTELREFLAVLNAMVAVMDFGSHSTQQDARNRAEQQLSPQDLNRFKNCFVFGPYSAVRMLSSLIVDVRNELDSIGGQNEL